MRRGIVLSYIVLFLFLSQSCTTILCTFKGYNVKQIKGSCATPEPGTIINPRCVVMSEMAAGYNYSPDSAFYKNKSLIKLITRNVRYLDDISIPVDGGEISMRVYNNHRNNHRSPQPVIVYYHGGGYRQGNIETFDYYCRKLVLSSGAVLVAVEYRLAPEYKFPVEVNDCYSALKWVSENIEIYGGDSGKLFAMGGSAGGNLAAVMPFVCNDRGGPELAGQILCYPVTTFKEIDFPSRLYFTDDNCRYILTRQYMLECRDLYLRGPDDISHKYASPLGAEIEYKLPRALIITAQCDPLRDEGRAYAEKLELTGNDVVHLEYNGMVHAFMPLYPLLREARKAIREVSGFIKD